MGELFVEGPDAGAALAAALVTDPPALAVGRAHYSMICAPDGGIIDDLIVYRLAEDRFLVVANAGNARGRVGRPGRAARRVRGGPRRPLARDRPRRRPGPARGRRARGRSPTSTSTPSATTRSPRAGRRASRRSSPAPATRARTASRCSSTTARTGELWDVLLDAVRAADGLPVGLGARDTLRLEAGMPLYGNELDRTTNPYDAGLGRVVKLGKAGDFVGRAALEKVARDGRAARSSGSTSRAAASPGTATRSTPASDAPASSPAAPSRRRSACRSRWPTSPRTTPSRHRCRRRDPRARAVPAPGRTDRCRSIGGAA